MNSTNAYSGWVGSYIAFDGMQMCLSYSYGTPAAAGCAGIAIMSNGTHTFTSLGNGPYTTLRIVGYMV